MIRHLDRIAGALVVLIGLAHLAVGRAAFTAPTAPRIWFASAGFLLVTAGLANLACVSRPSRLQAAAGISGGLAILILGALIVAGDRELLTQPQTLVLLALGVLLTVLRLRDLLRGG